MDNMKKRVFKYASQKGMYGTFYFNQEFYPLLKHEVPNLPEQKFEKGIAIIMPHTVTGFRQVAIALKKHGFVNIT